MRCWSWTCCGVFVVLTSRAAFAQGLDPTKAEPAPPALPATPSAPGAAPAVVESAAGSGAPIAPASPAAAAPGSSTPTAAAKPASDERAGLAAAPAAADSVRFFGGVRLGFEARSGDVTVAGSTSGPGSFSSSTIHYTAHQQVPVTVDLGARVSPNVTLGGYARLAAVLGGETDVSWAVGAVLGVLPLPDAVVSPWIALAVGYQSLGKDGTLTGLEIVPQLAVPFKVEGITLGPVVELTLADYSANASLCSDCSGWNLWGSLGLRIGWM